MKNIIKPTLIGSLLAIVVIGAAQYSKAEGGPEPKMTEQEYQHRVQTLQFQVLQSDYACVVDKLTQRVEYLEDIVSSKISRPDPTKMKKYSAFPCVDNSQEATDELYELVRFKSHFTGTGE